MAELPVARDVQLRKLKALAPPFHQHIARAKLCGAVCEVGDRVVVYEIVATRPAGPVQVTEDTVLRFE